MVWRRSKNESYESNDTEDPDVDFEQLINQAEDGEDEDWGLPLELKRIVEQEDREVKPHQEETKIVNLGGGSATRLPRHFRLVVPIYARIEPRHCAT